jgi:hypothetical protein
VQSAHSSWLSGAEEISIMAAAPNHEANLIHTILKAINILDKEVPLWKYATRLIRRDLNG